MAKMIGNTHPVGYGGKTCACCYEAPGKARKGMNRTQKRREKRDWKRDPESA